MIEKGQLKVLLITNLRSKDCNFTGNLIETRNRKLRMEHSIRVDASAPKIFLRIVFEVEKKAINTMILTCH